MRKQRFLRITLCIAFLLSLLLLILFPSASINGAKKGLILWFYQVIPSLLPFLILSGLFLSTGFSDHLASLLSPILSPLFGCSQNGCYAIVIGFLSGLPVGAKTVADLVSTGRITKKEGAYLLPLCNNAGPFFLLGYISVTILNAPRLSFPFLLCVWFSSVTAATLLRPKETQAHTTSKTIPHTAYSASANTPFSASDTPSAQLSFSFLLLDHAIEQAFSLLFRIGGYIVLFSVLAELLKKLPFPPLYIACLCSLFEITTGVSQLSALSLSDNLLIPLVGAFVSLGGLSGLAQTKSVLTGIDLPFAHYIRSKVLAACLAAILLLLFLRIR